jgi:glycosyltransferase involved in cell wall biosynthesis
MRNINLLYDATVLFTYSNSKNDGRSGVYWVAYNLLRQFEKSPNYKITLFGSNIADDPFLRTFPHFTYYDINKYKRNIESQKKLIKETKNIFTLALGLLRITKNTVLVLLYHLILSKIQKNKINKFNIFFSPFYAIPDIILKNSSVKSFHLLYDCVPILNNVPYKKDIDSNNNFLMILQSLNKETYYFCISISTKNDFLKTTPEQLDGSKMFVTHIATSQKFFIRYDRLALQKVFEKYGVTLKSDDLYIFSLCNIDPRKNLVFTAKCFVEFIEKHKIENMYFLLGGAYFVTYIDKFRHEISNFTDYQDKIIQLGYVKDEDVNILYSNSLFFTYLSQYEGFGIPPLEAMQAGTPVICSNNSSLPEVVGDAAITITYNDKEACIKAFEDFYFNENLRKEYIARGLERAKLFSWEKTFNIMNDEIIKAISNDKNFVAEEDITI